MYFVYVSIADIWSNSKYPNLLMSHTEQYIQHIRKCVIVINKYIQLYTASLLIY